MKLGFVLKCSAIALVSLSAARAQAATAWDEALNGDFSNDGLTPTPVGVSVGSNRIIGSTGNSGQGIDRDYFEITVPPGATLSSIVLLDNTSVSGSVSFIGMQAGPQLTVTPSGGGAEQLIALGHYAGDQIGSDLLPSIKLGAPGPLPSGTYSVWVQDTGGPASYGFDFVISASAAAAPALPAWWPMLLGLSLIGAYCGRSARLRRPCAAG